MTVLHGLVLDDGRRWGEAAEGWQQADAAEILDGRRRSHFMTRPRGASKTTDNGGIALAAMLEQAPAGASLYGFAADKDQARLLLDAVGGFVRRSDLGRLVDVQSYRAIDRRSLASLTILPADAAGSHGLLPWMTFVDELVQWGEGANPRGVWDAVVSAQPKVKGSRLVVLTTAGSPDHWSFRVLEHARKSRRWRVSELPGPLSWIDAEALEEQRQLLLPSVFERLHMNRWVTAEDRLTTLADVRSCVGHDGPLLPLPGRRYVAALDVGITNDRTVVTVAHGEPDEHGRTRVVVDRQEAWAGTKATPVDLAVVEAWIRAAAKDYGAELVFDPYQAAHLTQRLARMGVRCVEYPFSSTSIGRLAVTLFGLLRDHLLDLPDDEALLDELTHARLIERTPGQPRMDHASGRHDDRVISLALAAHRIVERSARGRGGLRFGGSERYTPGGRDDRHWSRQPATPGLEGMAAYLRGGP